MSCKKCGKETNNIVYCYNCQKQFKKAINELDKKINSNLKWILHSIYYQFFQENTSRTLY